MPAVNSGYLSSIVNVVIFVILVKMNYQREQLIRDFSPDTRIDLFYKRYKFATTFALHAKLFWIQIQRVFSFLF